MGDAGQTFLVQMLWVHEEYNKARKNVGFIGFEEEFVFPGTAKGSASDANPDLSQRKRHKRMRSSLDLGGDTGANNIHVHKAVPGGFGKKSVKETQTKNVLEKHRKRKSKN